MPLNTSIFIAYFLFAASLFFKYWHKDKTAVGLLLCAGFTLRLAVAYEDPFLHTWDECFHALVAKHMMEDPFTPVLRPLSLLPYSYTQWTGNYIWLHKQPLFMWQMALSMKLFGISVQAIRYPSVLEGVLMILVNYRIGWLLTQSKNIAYLSAVLLCFGYFQLIQTGGFGMDHNDIAFCFYLQLSFWAYAEYTQKQTIKWVVWIGIFAGCAVLNKWLTGLVIYAGWGTNILLSIKRGMKVRELKYMAVSLAACCLVFLPWQIYIHLRFLKESAFEAEFNSRHIYEVIEGHGGTWLFYLDNLDVYFGNDLWILLCAGVVVLWITKTDMQIRNALMVSFLSILVFFSIIVQTKIDGYIACILPIGFVFIAVAVCKPVDKLPVAAARPVGIVLSLFLGIVAFNTTRMYTFFDPVSPNRTRKMYNTLVYQQLKPLLHKDVQYVFNAPVCEDIDIMFFNDDLKAWSYTPNEQDFKIIAAKKLPIAVFKSREGYMIPDYISTYPYLQTIDVTLR